MMTDGHRRVNSSARHRRGVRWDPPRSEREDRGSHSAFRQGEHIFRVFAFQVDDSDHQLSKPAVLDSDSEHEEAPKAERDMETLRRRMEAQKLEAQRTGELDKLQHKQRVESQRKQEKRVATRGGSGAYSAAALPPPISPDEDPARDSYAVG